VSGWSTFFLGVIAVATLATAILQIAALIAAGRLARRIERLADNVEQELKPIFGHLNAIGRDASRAASLATAQVERIDRAFSDIAMRMDDTMNLVQSSVRGAARSGTPWLIGVRAALSVLKSIRSRRRKSGADDDDALFI
jgi:hypothetical protein